MRLACVFAWWDAPPAATGAAIDAPTRASLLMAIVVIALIGLMLMAAVLVAGGVARRKLRRPAGPTPLRRDEWVARTRTSAIPKDSPPPNADPGDEDSA